MNYLLFIIISRMKNLFLFLFVIITLFSCNSGVEKRNEKTTGVKPMANSTVSPSKEVAPAIQQNIQTPVQTQTMPTAKLNSNHTVTLLPGKGDPNAPDRNLLSTYAKNKINNTAIPLRKGNDPNLMASQDLLMSGTRKAKEGDHQGAIEDFTKSIALNKNATVYLRRGYSYLLLQNYQAAILDMNEVIKIAPNLDKAYFARAVCRFEMQDFKQAEDDLIVYMKTDKTSAIAYNYLAGTKFMQKNFKEALDNYIEVAKLDPTFPDVYTNRGMMRHYLGDISGAIQDYDLALKQDPSNASAFNNKGAAELRLKEYVAALSDLNNAIRIKKDYADAYDNRGRVKINLGDQQGACEDWQKAYSLGLEASRELIIKYCE